MTTDPSGPAYDASDLADSLVQFRYFAEYFWSGAKAAGVRHPPAGEDVPPAPSRGKHVFQRNGHAWRVGDGTTEVTIRDAKGLHYIAVLLRSPGKEISVLDLVDSVAKRPAPDPRTMVYRNMDESGLAGERLRTGAPSREPVLDQRARREYRDRLATLREELERARQDGDLGQISKLEAEREALIRELKAARAGMNRRDPSDPIEKARKAVTNCINRALGAIEGQHEALGKHLRQAITTGDCCAYKPHPPTTWDL